MAKPSPLLTKIEAQHKAELYRQRIFTLQYAQDAALIALAGEFGFGQDRAKRFCLAYTQAINDISRIIYEDGKTDHDVEYAKATIDRKLQEILGDNFAPWEVRYGAANE